MIHLKQTLTGMAAAAISAALMAVAVAFSPAANAESDNYYRVDITDEYITNTTPFTVNVNGDTPVCSMDFQGQSLTAAPWAFTYNPTYAQVQSKYFYDEKFVNVHLCDGSTEKRFIYANVPFEFPTPFTAGVETVPTVVNNTEEAATVTVVNEAGVTVYSETVQPMSELQLSIPINKTKTLKYTVTVTVPSGVSMSTVYTVGRKGWGLMSGSTTQTFTPCSTVTWAYDKSLQPKGAKTFEKDIVTSLKRLSKETGLTFVKIDDYANADIRYSFDSIGSAGLGGPAGDVTFSTTTNWVMERYAGFKPFKPHVKKGYRYYSGPAGRGWLIIHETMHVLGFDHVDNDNSVMAPVNQGQGKWTAADLDGLHTFYRDACVV